MAGNEADPNLVIEVTMDKLTYEQKHEVEQVIQQYRESCLQSYSLTRQGPMKKSNLPMPDRPGGSGAKTPADDSTSFQQAVDLAVDQALVSQTGVLAYEIQKMIKQSVEAAFNWEPWSNFIQYHPEPSAKDAYGSDPMRPIQFTVPRPEPSPNWLWKDEPPETFEADRRAPMRQNQNQNFIRQVYHEVSSFDRFDDPNRVGRNLFDMTPPLRRQPEGRQDED